MINYKSLWRYSLRTVMATYGPTTEPEEIDFTVAAPGLQ